MCYVLYTVVHERLTVSLMLICVVSACMYVESKMHQDVDLLGDSIGTML